MTQEYSSTGIIAQSSKRHSNVTIREARLKIRVADQNLVRN